MAGMPPRVFISYRAADGAVHATTLARDLGRVFGDDQVFLDKDDLRGGSHWIDEVGRALDARPVLLLLVTPALFGATDAAGRRRIDDPRDPIRVEVAGALAAGATLIPLLADGVDALPGDLPPPLDSLAVRTWRRLRAYDWERDLHRIVDDLLALGVAAAGARPVSGAGARARGAAIGALAAAIVLVLAGGAWILHRGGRAPQASAPAPAVAPITGLAGPWLARMGEDEVAVEIRVDGQRLWLESHPIDIRARADWAAYRDFWRGRFGSDLDAVRYRGEGALEQAAGSPAQIDIGFTIVSVPGDAQIDGGKLSATVGDDGSLSGWRWLNSVQAAVPATLRRLP